MNDVGARVPTGFVQAREGRFELDGAPYSLVGANCYYLLFEPELVDRVLAAAEAMKLRLLRIWAFNDGGRRNDDEIKAGGVVLQPSLGVYNEASFRRLDEVLFKAGEKGFKVIMTLTNYWVHYGGIPQYGRWLGLDDPEAFYTNPLAKQYYRQYIAYILERINTFTGKKYKDSPEIFAWQLCNEPRCKSDPTGDTLCGWVGEMTQYIKSLDPNHLVSIGDEGFFKRADDNWCYDGSEGVDWDRLIAIPTVDFCTFHMYPYFWRKFRPDGFTIPPDQWGRRYIIDHLRRAREIGKPCLLEEFNLRADEGDRISVCRMWLRTVEEEDGAADAFWLIGVPGFSGDESLCFYADTPEAALIAGHAEAMYARDSQSGMPKV